MQHASTLLMPGAFAGQRVGDLHLPAARLGPALIHAQTACSPNRSDSVPPAPALMLRMQLLLSCGPLRKTLQFEGIEFLEELGEVALRVPAGFWPGRPPARPRPVRPSRWKSSSCFSALSSGSILLRRELASSMSFWACSRLFQKFSAAIRALISPRRFCAPGTSKKPPQMGQFLGGGRQLGCDGVEHAGRHRG